MSAWLQSERIRIDVVCARPMPLGIRNVSHELGASIHIDGEKMPNSRSRAKASLWDSCSRIENFG